MNVFVKALQAFRSYVCRVPNLQAILDVMVNLQFPLVETLWKTFWRFSENQAGDAALAVYVCF